MAIFILCVWFVLASGHMGQERVIGATHLDRVKRSDDTNPLTVVVDQLSAQVTSLLARLGSLEAKQGSLEAKQGSLDTKQGSLEAKEGSLDTKQGNMDTRLGSLDTRLASLQHHAAFTAQFSVTGTKPQNAPLKFDKVIFNDGNAYDSLLGVFTAPFNGVYMFSAQVYTHGREESVVDIIVNGSVMSRMRVDSHAPQQYPDLSKLTTAIVKLTKGSKVWVQVPQGGFGLDFNSIYHSFFNGALLYPE